MTCPCAARRALRALKRLHRPACRAALLSPLLAALALAAPLCAAAQTQPKAAQAAADQAAFQAATAQAATSQDDDDRSLAPGPARHIIVKAVGQGLGPQEAEQNALHNARLLATRHYAALGGANALDLSPQGMRVIASHSTPPLGLSTVRAVALVELRLRALPEPPPAALGLPVLHISVDSARQVLVQANRACEVMVALDAGPDAEPEILPGNGGVAYRLAPGKPMRQALPQIDSQAGPPVRLRVLACTGGLLAPATAPTLDEALAKARAGKPRLGILQGVVSECVEVKAALPGQPAPLKRSLRQKAPQAPVNMTGAAGREAGLPVPNAPAKDLP